MCNNARGYNCVVSTWFSSKEIIETWILHCSLRLRRKTRQLRTQFGVQSLSICIKHFAEPFLHFRKALRWCAWCTYPWLESLAHMWFKPIVHSPQKNEASTVHLCAVCLFLWFINELRSYWVLHQCSRGSYFSPVLGGSKYFIGSHYVSEK